jgi:hypothetical protein
VSVEVDLDEKQEKSSRGAHRSRAVGRAEVVALLTEIQALARGNGADRL